MMTKGPVVDTGPLVNLLALHYVKAADIRGPRRNELLRDASNSIFDRDENLQERYYRYLEKYPRLNTTSHAIGEVCHVAGRVLHKAERERFWEISIEFLTARHLEEHLIRLVEVHQQSSFRKLAPLIGVADAGLAELALRLGVDLLTEDSRTLAGSLSDQIVSCIVVSEQLRYRY